MQHFPLRGLADQLLQRRFDHRRGTCHHFPLRRGRQRDLQAPLQILQPVERQPAAIFQQCQHTGRRRVILLAAHSGRRLRREDFSAQVAAQILQVVDRGRERRLSHHPHQHLRLFLQVDFPLLAFRAGISRLQRGMCNFDLLRASECLGRMTAMPRPRLLCRGFRRGLLLRCGVRIRRCGGHVAGLLRAGAKQNLPEPLETDLPVLQGVGQIRERFNRRLELFIVLLPQRLPHPRQDVFEFLSTDVDPYRRLHSSSARRARKSFTSGYPSTSLIDRLGRLLGQFFPRPVVRPITTQFAAR